MSFSPSVCSHIKQKDVNLWSKIKQWFQNLWTDLKAAVEAYKGFKPESVEGQIVSNMQDVIKDLEALFGQGLLDASDNYQAAKNGAEAKENTTTDSGAKYSDRYVVAHENNDILSIVERINNGDFKANDKVYLDAVSTENAEKIQKLTGISVDGFKVAIEARQIEHILKRHGANGISDHSMANPSDIAKMEYTLNEPDSIINAGVSKAYNYMVNGRNKNAKTVLYEKNIGQKSYYVVEAIPDTKAKTLFIVSAFIGESEYKKEALQIADVKIPSATANTDSASASNERVTQQSAEVKEKFHLRESVEETKNLVALHNLTEDKLAKSLELGGFPMPSIAITKSDIPHTNFGDITLVFGKETIDPKASKKNTVYQATAF